MKVTLFLQSKILEFSLPSQVSGNYSFDENKEEESKLINVEARDGKWILYGKDTISILDNNMLTSEMELKVNRFYLIQKDDNVYLIYTNEIFESDFIIYKYNEKTDLMIGIKYG